MSEASPIYTAFRNSTAWHPEYDLPLCPDLNNPHLYCSYAFKIMKAGGMTAAEQLGFLDRYDAYAKKCQIALGLLNRWPDGHGGMTSHDEVMGMAYLSQSLAQEILTRLLADDGVYITHPGEAEGRPSYDFNLLRFVWVLPFIKARALPRVGQISQSVWAAHMTYDALRFKAGSTDDAGGRLRNWIMLEAMEPYGISRAASSFWVWMMKRKSCTLKSMLAIEPREYSVFSELAPGEWR